MHKKLSVFLTLFLVVYIPIRLMSPKPTNLGISDGPTLTPVATLTPLTPVPTEIPASGPPLSLTLTLLFTCCAMGLVVGVFVIGALASRTNLQAVGEEKSSKPKKKVK